MSAVTAVLATASLVNCAEHFRVCSDRPMREGWRFGLKNLAVCIPHK